MAEEGHALFTDHAGRKASRLARALASRPCKGGWYTKTMKALPGLAHATSFAMCASGSLMVVGVDVPARDPREKLEQKRTTRGSETRP